MLVDANAFLPPLGATRWGEEVDRLVPGARLSVPLAVLVELRTLAGRELAGARVALGVAERLPVVPTEGHGDDAIVRAATGRAAVVLTADRGLRSRLLALGVPVLSPRDRTRLELHLPPSAPTDSPTVKSLARVVRRPRSGPRR